MSCHFIVCSVYTSKYDTIYSGSYVKDKIHPYITKDKNIVINIIIRTHNEHMKRVLKNIC